MSNLSDHVDRISALAKSIRATAAAAAPTSSSHAGPFTCAVLHTPLGDLIRDIDPAELGLFSLVHPPQPVIHDADTTVPLREEVTRVEFPGATPLRKPPASRVGRMDSQRPREHEPEVYAHAALRYLDRYQSIRPMPRASDQAVRIIERLEAVRASIQNLSDSLKQHSNAGPSDPPSSPKSAMMEEERRIQDTQVQIAELKKRKAELLERNSSSVNVSHGPPRAQFKSRPNTPPPPVSPSDVQEETFWNTPAAAARTLHFTGDSLLDEHVDLGNVSAVSFGSPVFPRTMGRPSSGSGRAVISNDQQTDSVSEPHEKMQDQARTVQPDDEASVMDDALIDEEQAEQTIVLKRISSPPAALERHSPVMTPGEASPPQSPSPSLSSSPQLTETPVHKRSKLKVTTELERIVSKIWVIVGELIMPGHPFDVTDAGTSKKRPPRAKETIAYLEELSARPPAPSSPTASSLSSFSLSSAPPASSTTQPSPQQVLTAYLLLLLLSSPPTHAMTLGKLKEALIQKMASTGITAAGMGVTRPIYGCVAKRLLKIERGGGEQVVKFDV